MITLTTLSTSVAFASTNEVSTREELVSQVEQLLIDAEKTGVNITKDDASKDINSLTEQELTDVAGLLTFAIENHTIVKENAAVQLKNSNSIKGESVDNLDSLIQVRSTGSSSSYICRAGIKYTNVSKTVPVNGKTKNISTNVAVYARWAYREVINGYTGSESNTYYKSNQQYASRGSSINIGTIKSFTQNTIAVERPSTSGFYVTGTGTYVINYGFLVIDFFVPFSQYFSIFDGTYQYSSTNAPF